MLESYYKNHNFIPFFININEVKPIGLELLNIIRDDEVLKPNINNFFQLEKIDAQILKVKNNIKNIDELIILDSMLISTYHTYMNYISNGIIDWDKFQEELKELDEKKEIIANWKKYDARKNIRELLFEAVDKNDINLAINQANYTFPKARELAATIKKYEQLALNGGYIKVPDINNSLKKGTYTPEIKTIRERLLQSNDLLENRCESHSVNKNQNNCFELFDENLFLAVKLFQRRHGLVEDGIIGKNTVRWMNIPIEKKIEKMRINLERMRWLPRTLGEKYVIVNIPDYNLRMYYEGSKTLEMAVIVGEKKHPTPIFSDNISSVVLNPYWRIPQRIVKKEIIPKLVEDPNYLAKNDIKAYENWSYKSLEYDVSSVDWSMYLNNDLIGDTKSAPMRFIQIPGENNPLGRIKFLFPNIYSVYMHDTPGKSLFKNNIRAYSHGCIRLSKPNELLKTIANEDKSFKIEDAEEVLSDIERKDLNLKKKIPVHIVYLTSWVDDEGEIQFRDDIYDYDRMQKKYIYN